MKWRNSKERELLASGGSRDQTLPNKNNPNPDLSDARNDRQPSMSPPSSPNAPPLSSPTSGHMVGHIGLNAAVAGPGSMSPRSDSYGCGSGDVQMKATGSADGMTASAVGNGNGGTNVSLAQSKQELFKYEFGETENRTAAGHMFNHFYDKLRDVNGIMTAGGFVGANVNLNGVGSGGSRPTATTAMVMHGAASPSVGASAAMSAFYDEYDSNSDSDEEISVT